MPAFTANKSMNATSVMIFSFVICFCITASVAKRFLLYTMQDFKNKDNHFQMLSICRNFQDITHYEDKIIFPC